jgi:hypothetical protein
MRRVIGAMVTAAALALGACAKGPPAVDALLLAPPVPADRTRLVVYNSAPFGFLSRAEVFVNGRRLGPVEGQSALYADIEPGVQRIHVNSQLAREAAIHTEAGEMVFVRLESVPLFGDAIGRITPRRVSTAVGQEALGSLRMTEWTP